VGNASSSIHFRGEWEVGKLADFRRLGAIARAVWLIDACVGEIGR
jgi:hypothetical protein